MHDKDWLTTKTVKSFVKCQWWCEQRGSNNTGWRWLRSHHLRLIWCFRRFFSTRTCRPPSSAKSRANRGVRLLDHMGPLEIWFLASSPQSWHRNLCARSSGSTGAVFEGSLERCEGWECCCYGHITHARHASMPKLTRCHLLKIGLSISFHFQILRCEAVHPRSLWWDQSISQGWYEKVLTGAKLLTFPLSVASYVDSKMITLGSGS